MYSLLYLAYASKPQLEAFFDAEDEDDHSEGGRRNLDQIVEEDESGEEGMEIFIREGCYVVQKRQELMSSVILLCICQIVLVVLIFVQAINPSSDLFNDLSSFPESPVIVIARFICAIVLHMSLQGELSQGM